MAALEYEKLGLRVRAVCAGVIHTAMIDRITGKDKVEKQYPGMEPLGRMVDPAEVAEPLWLCSNAYCLLASFCFI